MVHSNSTSGDFPFVPVPDGKPYCCYLKHGNNNEYNRKHSHIAQNIAETCQKYFQSFIANEILPQNFCQIL